MELKEKENSNIILLKAWDNDEYNFYTRSAIVVVDEAMIKDVVGIRQIVKIAKNLKSNLYNLHFWNYACSFVSENDFDDCSSEEVIDAIDDTGIEKKGLIHLESFDKEDDGVVWLRTESDCMVADEYGIRFEGFVKHTGVKIGTEKIPYEIFENIILPE